MKKQTHNVMDWVRNQNRYCFAFFATAFLAIMATASLSFSGNAKANSPTCNPRATRIDDAVCMQDMNQSVIDSMGTEEMYHLYDSRDGEEYAIAKLRDGKVWLLDNLRLGYDDETMVLTSNDTNIDSSVNGGRFVLPAGDEWEDSFERPYLFTGIKYAEIGSDSDSAYLGNHYNYCAASAGTYCNEKGQAFGDAKSDICPAGWRMPIGGSGGEYERIVDVYGDQYSVFVLRLTPAGRFASNGLAYDGERAYVWASNYDNGAKMGYLYVDNDGIDTTSGYDRSRGYSVRCVAKGNEQPEPEPEPVVCNKNAKTIDEANCLQDMNTYVKHSMALEERYELVDSRDGEIYSVAKLRDGNVWLLENLRLGKTEPITLTSEDTNLRTGSFVLPAGGRWEDTFTEPKISISRIYVRDVSDEKAVSSDTSRDWMEGNYYNFCAASAGTLCEERNTTYASAEDDICPANWRMPSAEAAGEYKRLYDIYGGTYEGFVETLKLPLSGYFYSNHVFYEYAAGYFWSPNYRDEQKMRIAYIKTEEVDTVSSQSRDIGFSIRCIAKMGDYGSGEYSWLYGNYYDGGDYNRLVLKVELDLDAFDHLEVNGRTLDKSNYVLESGSTVITFKNSYLDRLEDGIYALKVVYVDDITVDTEFIIDSRIVVPNTGLNLKGSNGSEIDNTIVIAMVGGAAVLVLVGGVVTYKRYHKKMTF